MPLLSSKYFHSQETDMFEFETSIARPSAHELHLNARRARGQAINALSRHAVGRFAEWLCVLARNGGARLARQLAAERQLRRHIRTLGRLDDRELADMGLGRSEIEYVVRGGRRPRTTDSPTHRRRNLAQQAASLGA
jgi:uncharacterized protein YjiS (DUF1127 family)